MSASWQDLDLFQPINKANPVNTGRVAWWLAVPQRSSGPNWYDFVSGLAATFTANVSGFGWTGQHSQGGAASVRTDGSTVAVNTNYNGLNSLSKGTIVFWANPQFAFNSATDRYFLGWNNGSTSEFDFRVFTDNNFYVGWFNNGTSYRVSIAASAANCTQNAWQMYAATWGPAGTTFYRNGVQLANLSTVPVVPTGSSPLYIGYNALGTSPIHTALYADDLQVFNRPLSATEISTLYQQSLQGYPDVLTWRDETISELAPIPPGLHPCNFAPWPDLELSQPINQSHPLNRGLAMRCLAIPQRFGGPAWYDFATNRTFQLQNFGAGYGWSSAGNPGGAGSIRFQYNTSNLISGPSKSLVSGSSGYTWWAWVRYTNTDISTIGSPRAIVCERPASGNWISELALEKGTAAANATRPFGVKPGTLELTIRDDTGNLTQLCGSDSLTDGNWHFVAGVRNGNQGAVYWSMGPILKTSGFATLNGTPGSTTTSAPLLQIGQDPQAGITSSLDGYVNDVGLVLHSMSSAELLSLFWESQQGYPNVLNWREDNVLDLLVHLDWYSPESRIAWPIARRGVNDDALPLAGSLPQLYGWPSREEPPRRRIFTLFADPGTMPITVTIPELFGWRAEQTGSLLTRRLRPDTPADLTAAFWWAIQPTGLPPQGWDMPVSLLRGRRFSPFDQPFYVPFSPLFPTQQPYPVPPPPPATKPPSPPLPRGQVSLGDLVIDDDTEKAMIALWQTNAALGGFFRNLPRTGRQKSTQPGADIEATGPYVVIDSRLDHRELIGAEAKGISFWADYRAVTITVYGTRADVVTGVAKIQQLFNRLLGVPGKATLTYPSGARFIRWWPNGDAHLLRDPDNKAGKDVWCGVLRALVWSVRSE